MSSQATRSEGHIVLETVQWSRLEFIETIDPISDRDYAVLNELREVLLRHGYEKRFGISLLHKHFDLQPGEIALEESDEVLRVSTIRVVSKESSAGAMETAWRFGSSLDIDTPMKCELECRGRGMTDHNRRHSGRRIPA
ncbi:MAG: hypothetical protein QM740_17805 [Acidovorax sp.]